MSVMGMFQQLSCTSDGESDRIVTTDSIHHSIRRSVQYVNRVVVSAGHVGARTIGRDSDSKQQIPFRYRFRLHQNILFGVDHREFAIRCGTYAWLPSGVTAIVVGTSPNPMLVVTVLV